MSATVWCVPMRHFTPPNRGCSAECGPTVLVAKSTICWEKTKQIHFFLDLRRCWKHKIKKHGLKFKGGEVNLMGSRTAKGLTSTSAASAIASVHSPRRWKGGEVVYQKQHDWNGCGPQKGTVLLKSPGHGKRENTTKPMVPSACLFDLQPNHYLRHTKPILKQNWFAT